MGGGGSKSKLPPIVKQDPYPAPVAINNLSLSPTTTVDCRFCNIQLDDRATTSSVKLTRDFGNVSDSECQSYQNDLESVRKNQMSFRDFFLKLQNGNYTRPISQEGNKGFCAQVMFSAEDAAKINNIDDFDKNIGSLKTIRIRQVTGGGSFSSGTKAKFRLSIPIKVSSVIDVTYGPSARTEMRNVNGKWQSVLVPGPLNSPRPISETFDVYMLTMYHPSPVRIENIQHDAILSINDPSDPNARTVILIPLKSSNMGEESVGFFNKIAKHLTTITSPDPVTGLYPETNIPTGNNWNIKSLFWLSEPDKQTNLSTVTDAYYTWMGAQTFNRKEVSRVTNLVRGVFNQDTITYGWVPSLREDGTPDIVRYYMLKEPIAISPTDLSFLLRSLPPTPAEEAIHKISDPTQPRNPKILHKRATGRAAAAKCGVVRERMTNPGPGDMVSSLLTGGSVNDLLVDDKGNPIDTCDPFAMNAKNAKSNAGPFTPTKMFATFFNVMILVAIGFGAWIAFYFVANKNYDYSYRDFSKDAGKVVGALAARIGAKTPAVSAIKTSAAESPAALPALSTLPKVPSLSNLSGLLGKKV